MIAGGTTCFIDIFRHPHEAALVAQQSGLRATFSPQVIDDPVGPGETLHANEEFVDAWHQRVPDRIRAWFGPHALYSCRPETFRRMRALADRYQVGIHTHLAESRAETDIVAERSGGRTPVEWLDELVGLGPDVLAAHCVEIDDADLVRLASAGVGIAHCPTSNAKLGNGRARIVELLAAGANVGLGTDSNMTNNDLDMFEELRLAALVQKQATGDPTVLPSHQMLRLATMGSARALGLEHHVGSLEVGKYADLAVVDLRGAQAHPIVRRQRTNVVEQVVWASCARDVRHTVVAGRVLMEDRRLLTLDLTEVVDLADTAAVDLLAAAGVLERRFGSP
jgi:5-methylthioadenosine/S-adenosylhomocysteine deaminase